MEKQANREKKKKDSKSEASSMKHVFFYNDKELKLGFTIAVHQNKII